MKKSLSILVLTLFILSILVSAQSNESSPSITKIDLKNPTPKLDEKIEKEITIPDGFKTLSRFILGINPNQSIKISVLVTTVALITLFFMISLTGMQAIPLLNPLSSTIAAVCLTLLISATKALSTASEKWLGNKDFFIFIDGWEFGNFLITIFALIILFVAALYFKEKIKKDIELDKKENFLDIISAEAQSKIKKKTN